MSLPDRRSRVMNDEFVAGDLGYGPLTAADAEKHGWMWQLPPSKPSRLRMMWWRVRKAARALR